MSIVGSVADLPVPQPELLSFEKRNAIIRFTKILLTP